jgi:hypothetical protein
VRLAQPDHAFELTRCRGDAAIGSLDRRAQAAHLDVRVDEGLGGGRRESRVDVGARVGYVCCQELNRLYFIGDCPNVSKL